MQVMVGDPDAILGVHLYRPAFSAHRFRWPHIIAIGYLIFGRQCHVPFNDKQESSPLPDHRDDENEAVDRKMMVTVA
jgi:hypothetical protein